MCISDTDHSQRMGIENNCPAQDRRIGCKALLPESEVQKNYRRASHLLLFVRKTPADGGFETGRREKIGRFEPALYIVRLCPRLPTCQGTQNKSKPEGLGLHHAKRSGVIPVMAIVGVGKLYSFPESLYRAIETNVRGGILHLCGLCLNHGVDQRKDRCAQTNPQRQANRRQNSEAGIFREHTRSESQVANQVVPKHTVCGFVEPLLC
ncbi:MAG: hypothetical protein DMG57_27190 [Acidobacteria bacterium]|nr:MAG: hypothetical protein DMG57_27190 [Acidobacteriota bacterium]